MEVPTRARTASRAVERYKSVLQLALSCLGPTVWITAGRSTGPLSLLTQGPAALRRGSGDSLYFLPTQDFVPKDSAIRNWRVRTLGYAYTVFEDADLAREIVSWHWHPTTRPDTHIHIGDWSQVAGRSRHHVPSGRVSFEHVVRFLIEDFDVVPARPDWDAVLIECHDRFTTHRSWADWARSSLNALTGQSD